MKTDYDILIIGGGPAGAMTALGLEKSGLQVALLDKARFPRDKVCGDAIPGISFRAIERFIPKYAAHFADFQELNVIKSAKLFLPRIKPIQHSWVLKAGNCTRLDFDNRLMDLVKQATATTIFEAQNVKTIQREKDRFFIQTKTKQFTAKLVIGADGANGVSAKQLTDFSLNRQHHCAAVRAYYTGVEMEKSVNEFYLFRNHSPGYFWIFPLANGGVNVGFGMLSKEVSKRKINLTKSLKSIIAETPKLQEKFANATLQGKVIGYGLPLGSRRTPLAGTGFMLCGDAGSLIDPLAGHGIDKALWSGGLAAQQAILAFQKNRFDAAFLKEYEKAVYKEFGWEFTRNYWIMKIGNRFLKLL